MKLLNWRLPCLNHKLFYHFSLASSGDSSCYSSFISGRLNHVGCHKNILLSPSLYSCVGPFLFSRFISARAMPKLYDYAMILPSFLPFASKIVSPLTEFLKPLSIALKGLKFSTFNMIRLSWPSVVELITNGKASLRTTPVW